ncbi:MAG: hypothetical protein ACE37E_12660 [Hyphomicrobiales bacterium]
MTDTSPADFTTGLREELSDLQADVTSLSGDLTRSLTKALVEGQELDGLLQQLILSQSNSALTQAMDSAYGLVGSLGESLIGAAIGGVTGTAANIFNVNVATPDATSFRGSETQLTASLSRAVSRGQRGL